MHIERLEISHVRNLSSVRLTDLGNVNIFSGDNGSGKTSLLESIHILGIGRSFRTRLFKAVIQKGKEESVVFCTAYASASDNVFPVGVRRSRDSAPVIRINGENVASSATLAKLFPVQLINSDAFLLLEGPPSVRRQFLDWGVFHVEHKFHKAWLTAKRCLKHRNTLLRHGKISGDELSLWTSSFVRASDEVDSYRRQYIIDFIEVFESIVAELAQMSGIKIEYRRGWQKDKGLDAVLSDCVFRDKHQGFTSFGPHKAELRITKDGSMASEYLSRGQEKLLICALKLAQAAAFERLTGKKCIFLIDDLPSELDAKYREILCRYLERLKCQVFVTCTDRNDFDGKWSCPEQIKWFHVEHGQIKQAENA